MVQGSINASFLYTSYNLEVVHLPKIMKNVSDFREVTGEEIGNHEDINHDVLNYIDDSNNSIAASSTPELIKYT